MYFYFKSMNISVNSLYNLNPTICTIHRSILHTLCTPNLHTLYTIPYALPSSMPYTPYPIHSHPPCLIHHTIYTPNPHTLYTISYTLPTPIPYTLPNPITYTPYPIHSQAPYLIHSQPPYPIHSSHYRSHRHHGGQFR